MKVPGSKKEALSLSAHTDAQSRFAPMTGLGSCLWGEATIPSRRTGVLQVLYNNECAEGLVAGCKNNNCGELLHDAKDCKTQ